MATKKRFDCVNMKHQAAIKVQAKLSGMSREEQLEFWHARTQELLALQRRVIRKTKAS